jgi:hypothetical protein
MSGRRGGLLAWIMTDWTAINEWVKSWISGLVAHLSKGMPETPRAQGGPRSDTRDLWRRW